MKINDTLYVAADKACIIAIKIREVTPESDTDNVRLTTQLLGETQNQRILGYFFDHLQQVTVNSKDVSQGTNIFSEQQAAVKFLNDRRLIEIADLQHEIDKLKIRQINIY